MSKRCYKGSYLYDTQFARKFPSSEDKSLLSYLLMITENPPSKYLIDNLCSLHIGRKILQINLHDGLFDVPTVDRILLKIDAYTEGKQYLTIINCDPSARTTFKALRRMGRPTAMQYSIAKAYVIGTLHQKVMANIFLILFKPKKPVKFFRDQELAKKWLEELV